MATAALQTLEIFAKNSVPPSNSPLMRSNVGLILVKKGAADVGNSVGADTGLSADSLVRSANSGKAASSVTPWRKQFPVRGVLEAPWTESDCMALALVTCNCCFGSGCYSAGTTGRLKVCNCVLRAVFRACYAKWQEVGDGQLAARIGSSANHPQARRALGRRAWFWARPREEFRADFELIARRTLDTAHYAVFRLHFLEGLDWKACCRRLRIDRGNFFHSIYRVEERLGRAYREAAPYALFPVYDYFSVAA